MSSVPTRPGIKPARRRLLRAVPTAILPTGIGQTALASALGLAQLAVPAIGRAETCGGPGLLNTLPMEISGLAAV